MLTGFNTSDPALETFFAHEKRLESMIQAFGIVLLVLDRQGKILDYKTGGGTQFSPPLSRFIPLKFQDFAPTDVLQKYRGAVRELHEGGKFAMFEYRLRLPAGDAWCESFLMPFADGQKNIMFVWNVTHYKRTLLPGLALGSDRTIQGWLSALHLRDQETGDHAHRVTEMSLQLARRLGIPEAELIHIRRGAMLHDIGKVAIPDSILFKPAPLTDDEWDVMRRHPVIATEILSPISYFAPAMGIPRSHHEKWDGSGYPDGLAGEAIPLAARIFAFADVYDALTSDRPYRGAWSQSDALSYIYQQAGAHFDPSIAPVFIDMFSE
ncbi:MAG: HD domain-containing protein [Anaerolineales bacterium]|nr:HD domain-containing protein [Anaerolineales bacterium]